MFKRHLIVLASLLVAMAPLMPLVAAGNATEWTELPTSQTWEYTDYQVDRLSSTSNTLMTFGDTLVRVDRASACSGACDLRDLFILQNGGAVEVENIPTVALDEQLVVKSDGRLVYAEFSNDNNSRVNVIEVDLATGVKSKLLKDVFVNDADEVKVVVDGEMIYAEVTFAHSSANTMFPQSQIYVYNPRYKTFEPMYHQYRLQKESLIDVQNEQALVKMTFPSGEEQLWVYDYVEFGEESGEAVPGSWTGSTEDIVGAHFLADGSIEYFRQYTRTTASADLSESDDSTDYLSWYRSYDLNDLRNIVQVSGSVMAFVSPENELFVSNDGQVIDIGFINVNGNFRLVDGMIIWGDGVTGAVSTVSGVKVANLDFTPSDLLDDVVVGQDVTGNVVYKNLSSGKELIIGYGGSPRISDARHVYWKGTEDAKIYQASVYLSTTMDTAEGAIVKTSGSSKLYSLVGDTVSYIPNTVVYASWFSGTTTPVVTISREELASYEDVGSLGLKPGTLLSIDDSYRVYVVGSDGYLHWIVTSEIAIDLFGTNWNANIVSVTSKDVLDYGRGLPIESANDMAKTVMIATE